jgi:hypothetical protein
MSDELLVDPAQLYRGSDRTFSAMHDAAVALVGYENDLSEAAPGWIGASQRALAEVAASWEARNAAHQSRLTVLSQKMTEAAFRYATADDEPGRWVDSVGLARKMGS